MNISVNDLTSVDKEITITATRDELTPAFEKAYTIFAKKAQIPGFRVGKVPVDLVKKRYGRDIELDEVRNYVLDVYNDKILDEYKPVGETDFKKIDWENDKLEAVLAIGIEPQFELTDLSKIEIDRMVHDASEDDVDKEIAYLLEKEGTWEEAELAATDQSLVVADVFGKDHDGNLLENDVDQDMEFNLRNPKNEDYKPFLVGKVAGDEVDAEIKHGDHSHLYRIHIKSVKKLVEPELNEALIEKVSNGEYKNIADYRAFLKSNVQQYFDETTETMLKNDLADALIKSHDFEVPETLQDLLIKRYVEDLRIQYKVQQKIDYKLYKTIYKDKAVREAKWYYINQKLGEKLGDSVEVSDADLDKYIERFSVQSGYPVDVIKGSIASNPEEVENVKVQLREEKVFEKAIELVKITDLSKDEYEKKHNAENADPADKDEKKEKKAKKKK